jgi:hypothetical protein
MPAVDDGIPLLVLQVDGLGQLAKRDLDPVLRQRDPAADGVCLGTCGTEIGFEGCLSLWEWRGRVARLKRIVFEYLDTRILHVREESEDQHNSFDTKAIISIGVLYQSLRSRRTRKSAG